MTNEQIITIVISSAVSAVVSSIARPFTEKIFATFMPDTKTIISFLKKAFFLLVRYGVCIFWIIRLLISTDLPFDKIWVLQFSLQFLILSVTASFDIFMSFFVEHFQITKENSIAITRIAEVAIETTDVLSKMTKVIEEQTNNSNLTTSNSH